jgi:hypothetical protein
MARPKLTEEHRRSVNFTVRLTDAEVKKLEALAAVCGKAPGILIRDKVFKGRFPEPKSAKLDRDAYFELKKIGVNLNQLARKANSNIVPVGLLGLIIKLQKQQEIIIKLLLHDRQSENR